MANFDNLFEKVWSFGIESDEYMTESVIDNGEITEEERDELFVTEGAYKKHLDYVQNKLDTIKKISKNLTGENKKLSENKYDALKNSNRADLRALDSLKNCENLKKTILADLEKMKADKSLISKIKNAKTIKDLENALKRTNGMIESRRSEVRENKTKWMKDHEQSKNPVGYKNSGTSPDFKKESVDEIRLEIYESCHNGEITEEERDELLHQCESVENDRQIEFVTEGAFKRAQEDRSKKYHDTAKLLGNVAEYHKANYILNDGEESRKDAKKNLRAAAKEYSVNNTKHAGEDAKVFGRGKRYYNMYYYLQNKIHQLQKLKKDGSITPNQEKELKSAMDKMKSAKEKWMKTHGNESVKESVDELKLEIYESCHNGEITEEERDILLGIVQ